MSKMSLAFLLVVFSFAAEAQTNQENSPTAEEKHARRIAKTKRFAFTRGGADTTIIRCKYEVAQIEIEQSRAVCQF